MTCQGEFREIAVFPHIAKQSNITTIQMIYSEVAKLFIFVFLLCKRYTFISPTFVLLNSIL